MGHARSRSVSVHAPHQPSRSGQRSTSTIRLIVIHHRIVKSNHTKPYRIDLRTAHASGRRSRICISRAEVVLLTSVIPSPPHPLHLRVPRFLASAWGCCPVWCFARRAEIS